MEAQKLKDAKGKQADLAKALEDAREKAAAAAAAAAAQPSQAAPAQPAYVIWESNPRPCLPPVPAIEGRVFGSL